MKVIAKNLSKNTSNKNILDDVCLHIKNKEIYGLIGPNGSGKTSLIRTLMGIYKPTSGSIKINGTSPFDKDFFKLKSKIGFVMDHLGLYKDLTPWQNLEFFHRIYFPNSKKFTREEDIKSALNVTSMYDKKDSNITFLSKGQKQRIAISRAILTKPLLLILDEPTTGLDIEGIILLRELLKNINKSGTTILISSHNLDELQKICSKFAFIKNGKIIKESNFNKLKSEYSFSDEKINLEDIYKKIFNI